MEPVESSVIHGLLEAEQRYGDLSRDVDLLFNVLINLRKGVHIKSLAFNDTRLEFIYEHIMYIVENGIKITVDANKSAEN